MRNILFPLLGKGPVFGGGGGGGGGGGDSGGSSSTVTASSKGSGGGGYTSIRDMFDGGGPGQSGSTFGGALGGISNAIGASPVGSRDDSDRSDPAPAAPPPAAPPPAAPGTIAGFGQDYNNDGRIGIGEVLRDMTDAGGPGGSGGAYSGGPLAGISNVVTGQFEDVRDMLDGGGPGQSGDRFEGSLVGTAANILGLPPLPSGPTSGSVYEGPTLEGPAGYLQDPGLMTSDPETGFITSDENVFRPAPVERIPDILPPLDVVMSGRNEPPPALVSEPAVVAPPAPPPAPAIVEPPPVSMGFLPPTIQRVGGAAATAAPTVSPFSFEDYLARLSASVPSAAPVAPMPISTSSGMPLMLGSPSVAIPDVQRFFQPPPPAIPSPDPNFVPVRPENRPYVPAMPGPSLTDPKGPGGTTGAIPPGGIASLGNTIAGGMPLIVPRVI